MCAIAGGRGASDILECGIATGLFSCAVMEVGRSGAMLESWGLGQLSSAPDDRPASVRTTFDLASLTKVLCTATLTMRLAETGRLGLSDPISRYVPQWTGIDREAATVGDLLEHCVGLPAHRPYFETIAGRHAFQEAIAREPLEYQLRSRAVYSDLGFMLLGFMLEDLADAPLDAQFNRWRDDMGHAAPLAFGPVSPGEIAATEVDPRRGRLLRGEVHDGNAHALGGVAGHAGLFGTASAVGGVARWWLQRLRNEDAPAEARSWARRFVRRSAVPGSSRALGWDAMLPTSSCGTCFSAAAVGHTGFTGTSVWIDPQLDLYVVLLTNRTAPATRGAEMQVLRRAFHDAVVGPLSV